MLSSFRTLSRPHLDGDWQADDEHALDGVGDVPGGLERGDGVAPDLCLKELVSIGKLREPEVSFISGSVEKDSFSALNDE